MCPEHPRPRGEGGEAVTDSLDYEALDPGIREVVRLIRDAGYETTDSGDGISKRATNPDALPFPHVVVVLLNTVDANAWADETCRIHEMVRSRFGTRWKAELSWEPDCLPIVMVMGPEGASMTRHIRLPLGSTTTETHCGDCTTNARTPGICTRFNLYLDATVNPRRLDSCRAAEVKDEDQGAIIRLLSLLVRAPTDDDGRPEIECSRETLVNMAMAARKELDALRAKTKDEEE